MISPSKDTDVEIAITPPPKTPPDHHLSGHVNLSFEPYMFQPSNDVPFYYTPYSNAWNQNYREEDNLFIKMKYTLAFGFIVFIIVIIIITYIIIDTTIVSTVKKHTE
uniref:U24 n=1 Tax=Strongyloides stercoralis TaxID=6248 RepID=A0A0K0DSU3_STRER